MDGAACRVHQGNGKLVASAADLFAVRDQKSLLMAILGKERTQPIFRGVLLGIVGQHQQACFMIASLPCREKSVRNRESRYVVRIGDGLDLWAGENRSNGRGNQNRQN